MFNALPDNMYLNLYVGLTIMNYGLASEDFCTGVLAGVLLFFFLLNLYFSVVFLEFSLTLGNNFI